MLGHCTFIFFLSQEPKFGEPEPERNLGHSAKEVNGSSKGLVQNLEEKVGIDTVDNAKIPTLWLAKAGGTQNWGAGAR